METKVNLNTRTLYKELLKKGDMDALKLQLKADLIQEFNLKPGAFVNDPLYKIVFSELMYSITSVKIELHNVYRVFKSSLKELHLTDFGVYYRIPDKETATIYCSDCHDVLDTDLNYKAKGFDGYLQWLRKNHDCLPPIPEEKPLTPKKVIVTVTASDGSVREFCYRGPKGTGLRIQDARDIENNWRTLTTTSYERRTFTVTIDGKKIILFPENIFSIDIDVRPFVEETFSSSSSSLPWEN